MIEGRRNHPSIVMWEVFNEGWGQFDTERLTALVKQLDPTRLVDNATGGEDKGAGEQTARRR
jgi:beta-galactosidase/beta-glucuronidase